MITALPEVFDVDAFVPSRTLSGDGCSGIAIPRSDYGSCDYVLCDVEAAHVVNLSSKQRYVRIVQQWPRSVCVVRLTS